MESITVSSRVWYQSGHLHMLSRWRNTFRYYVGILSLSYLHKFAYTALWNFVLNLWLLLLTVVDHHKKSNFSICIILLELFPLVIIANYLPKRSWLPNLISASGFPIWYFLLIERKLMKLVIESIRRIATSIFSRIRKKWSPVSVRLSICLMSIYTFFLDTQSLKLLDRL